MARKILLRGGRMAGGTWLRRTASSHSSMMPKMGMTVDRKLPDAAISAPPERTSSRDAAAACRSGVTALMPLPSGSTPRGRSLGCRRLGAVARVDDGLEIERRLELLDLEQVFVRGGDVLHVAGAEGGAAVAVDVEQHHAHVGGGQVAAAAR